MANHHSSGEQVDEQVRIPIAQEELHVGKRIVDTGAGVRLHKTVSEEVWRVDDLLRTQTLDIEHVPVNAWIEGQAPGNRYEGNTLIVPVIEEVLIVEKRLRLKEEIRITASTQQQPVSERVVLRQEQIRIERFDDAVAGAAASSAASRSPP